MIKTAISEEHGINIDILVLGVTFPFSPINLPSNQIVRGQVFIHLGRRLENIGKMSLENIDCTDDAKFNHRLTNARWDGDSGKWRFTIEDLDSGKTLQDDGDFFFSCMGQFNNWKWPDIPDREHYKGTIMHSADWDETYNFHQKIVALIGSGSSAVQILPKLQPIVKHLDAYIRNQMWISPRFGADYIMQNNPELADTNFELTEDLKRRFLEDEEFYFKVSQGDGNVFQFHSWVHVIGSSCARDVSNFYDEGYAREIG